MRTILITWITVLVSSVSVFADDGYMMGGYGSNHMGGWFGGMAWFPMILFWVVIIASFAFLVKWMISSNKNESGRTPLDILKERYAKGEINEDEFEQKKRALLN